MQVIKDFRSKRELSALGIVISAKRKQVMLQ